MGCHSSTSDHHAWLGVPRGSHSVFALDRQHVGNGWTVGSIVGMGGMAGAIGGTVFPLFVGALLDHFKALGNVNAGYNILFAICGSAYVIAWTIMRLIRSSNPRTDLGSMRADSVT